MRVPLRRLFPATSLACEALSVAALYLSGEIPGYLFAVMAALGVCALSFRLGDRWLLPLIAGTVLCGIYAGSRLALAVGILVAAPTLVVHALTWLGRKQGRYRYWRIGLAFLEMILAGILAPEAHMFFLIFFFVVLLSLTLSFGFLEQNFARRDPAGLERPLHPAYLAAVLLLSFVIFLSSLVIFPLLPRKEGAGGGPGAMPGFSEEVSFQTAAFYWTGDESRPVMWLFLPAGSAWEEALPYGLLRGKSLERFDGKTWRVGTKRAGSRGGAGRADARIEILREPMPSDALPVPYGTEGVESRSAAAPPVRLVTGEWTQPGGSGRRISYVTETALRPESDRVRGEAQTELPEAGFARLRALAREVGARAGSDRERALAVLRYFQSGFAAERVPVAAAAEKGSSPVEAFLFETKRGHCELFATAAALMLRSLRVPARLVVGFRAPPAQRDARALTIRNGDAHAWVEAWIDGRWQVLDPTPAIPAATPAWQAARDFYDWVTAYWHRYILAYEFDGAAVAKWLLIAGAGLAGLALAARIGRRLGAARAGPREEVAAIRARLERKLKLDGSELDAKIESLRGGKDWRAAYLRLRFGPRPPEPPAIRELRARAVSLVRAARAEPSARPGR